MSVAYRCLREGGVDYGSVAYSDEEGGIFWRDSGRVAYLRGCIYWEGEVDTGRAGWILEASHIVVENGGIFWKDVVDSVSPT